MAGEVHPAQYREKQLRTARMDASGEKDAPRPSPDRHLPFKDLGNRDLPFANEIHHTNSSN